MEVSLRRFLFLLFVTCVLLGFPLFGYAQFQTYEFHDIYFDAEALGMGNAQTAASSDLTALYYNPANLEAGNEWRWYNFTQVEGSPSTMFDAITRVGDIVTVVGDPTKSNAEKLNDTFNIISPLSLQNMRIAANVGTIMTWKGLGLGLNIRAANLNTMIGPDSTEVFIREISDVSVLVGKSFSFFNDRLWLGAVSRLIYRFSFEGSVTLDDVMAIALGNNASIENMLSEGVLLDLDLGATYFLPFLGALNGRISVVLAHVFPQLYISSFNMLSSTNNENVVKENRRLHVGYAMSFNKLGVIVPTVAVDVRNIGSQPGDFFKHLHLGTSLALRLPAGIFGAALRGGISQGYWSAGVSMNLWWFHLDTAYYAEEVGAQTGQNPDRRLIIRFSFQPT